MFSLIAMHYKNAQYMHSTVNQIDDFNKLVFLFLIKNYLF